MSGAQVVFFGAGYHAGMVFGELSKTYAPVAFADNDAKKQGTCFMGLPVLSLDEIETRYPGCRFFVTVNELTKPDIITSLIVRGVTTSRIINYEESKRYKSCNYLETLMYYYESDLYFCCSDFWKSQSPCVVSHGLTREEHLKTFFNTRDRIIDELNMPSSKANTPNLCAGCSNVKDGYWYSDRRIRFLNLYFKTICNFKCSYCPITYHQVNDLFYATVEQDLNFLLFLKEKQYIDTNTVIMCAAGEITVHPLRDKILAAIQDHPCWFFSNASVYSEKIAEILAKGKGKLCPSLDAGTRETFAKIKGVDLFDRVCENLRRYSADAFVHLKYIVLPGVNDNEADINGFIRLCEKLNIKAVDITRDCFDARPLTDHTIGMVAKMLSGLQEIGVCAYAPDYIFLTKAAEKQRLETMYGEMKNA